MKTLASQQRVGVLLSPGGFALPAVGPEEADADALAYIPGLADGRR